MLFPSFFAQNLLHFSFIIIAFATSNHPFKPMTTQAMIKIIADYFKTQPVLKAWLFGSFARGEVPPIANRTPRLRQGVPEGYGMVYPSGTIFVLSQNLGAFSWSVQNKVVILQQ